MDLFNDRRFLLTVGGGLIAVLIAAGLGVGIMSREHKPKAAPPASVGGLVVQMGRDDDAKVDPTRQLRCFVNGQFVGLETLADCARKNGVATQALDVGIDQTGALGAGEGSALTPLPPPATPAAVASTSDIPGPGPVTAQRGPVGDCLRYSGQDWRKVGESQSLNACVQALFAGRCEKSGGASYGRWATQTLRLVPHRVEISSDNKSFRTLVEQADAGCSIPDAP
jgi:hypothetical protein